MKLTKLLVLMAMVLLGANAKAAVPDGVWTLPEPQGLEFTEFISDGTRYYLYNAKAHMFFASGNGWNTQASLRTFGMEIWLMPATEADAPSGSYELCDNNVNNPARSTGEGNMFTDDGDATWVDHASQANYSWGFELVDGCARFQNVALIADKPEFAGKYLGWDGTYVLKTEGSNGGNRNAYTAILKHVDPAAEGVSVDWKAVTVASYEAFVGNEEAYNAYATGVEKYIASIGLKEALEKGEQIGADVSAQLAVYTNTQSTLEELQEATTKTNEAIEEREKEIANGDIIGATGQNPKDASVWITNGTFDTIGDFHGWSGTAFGAGGTTSTNAEHYDRNFDTYQDITVKYPGLYLFGVKGFYRAGSSDESYTHFMANDEDARLARFYVTVGDQTTDLAISNIFDCALGEKPAHGSAMASNGFWIPNTMADADKFFHTDGLYGHLLPVEIEGTDVKVRIGVKKEKNISANWSLFDDFSLIFCGAGDDRYVGYAKTAAATYPEYENVIATQSYLDAYNALRNNPTGTDKASVEAYIASLDAAKAELAENMKLWKQWEALVTKAVDNMEDYYDLTAPEVDELIEYADPGLESNKASEIRAARSLNNDELKAEIDKLTNILEILAEALKNQIQPGEDVTAKLLVNPGFEDGTNGWTIVSKGGGNVQLGGNNANHCFEAWHSTNFDIYQEVKDAPVGVYEISVKGYVRYLDGADAINNKNNQPEDIPIYVYLNDVKNQFANWFSYPKESGYYKAIDANATVLTDMETEMEYPDNMTAASIAFNEGGYLNAASGLIAKKGDVMRIGVKGTPEARFWPIWDDFKLIYKGYDLEIVKAELEKAIANAEKQMDKTFATDQKAKLAAAIEDAKAALDLTDGKEMFQKLAALVSVDVDGSIQKFEQFNTVFNEFETTLANASDADEDTRPDDAVIIEASQLLSTLQGYVDGEFTDAQLDQAMEDMEAMTKKLAVPAAMGKASDATPANATYLVKNPDYDGDNGDNWSLQGNNPGNRRANTGVYEVWNTNADVLVYQDLTDMPEGTYELSVQGMYRFGTAKNEYTAYTEDATAHNNGALYLKVGENEMKSNLPRLSLLVQDYESPVVVNEETGEKSFPVQTDWDWATDITVDADSTSATGKMLPNMLSTITPFFEDETVTRTGIIFKVGEEGTARIGISIKYDDVPYDWAVWDNWKLMYYGKNSSKEPGYVDGIKDAATLSNVVKTEVFGLSGVRVKSGKGVAIIRQTMSDGSVRMKKVMVK